MVKFHCRASWRSCPPPRRASIFIVNPPEWIRDPRRKIAGAGGGLMLVLPAALQRIGGIAAIRQEIVDVAPWRAPSNPAAARRGWASPATLRSLRSVRLFGQIERMIARTVFDQLRHSSWLLLGAVAEMTLLYLLPLSLLASRALILAVIGGERTC